MYLRHFSHNVKFYTSARQLNTFSFYFGKRISFTSKISQLWTSEGKIYQIRSESSQNTVIWRKATHETNEARPTNTSDFEELKNVNGATCNKPRGPDVHN